MARFVAVAASLLGVLLGLAACQSPGRVTPPASGDSARGGEETRILALTEALERLDRSVPREEAAALARAAVTTARQLAEDYAAVKPAWFHNTLVNLGLRRRGLCYHWADDLAQHLAGLPQRRLIIRPIVARAGTRREHNALVVHLVNRPPETGLVLDAWRYGGRLYWGPLKTDKYPWRPAD